MSRLQIARADRVPGPKPLAARPRIAVIVPSFNEERNVPSVFRELESLQRRFPQWELRPIFVNDGSTDSTEAVLHELTRGKHATVITLPVNLGIGRAVQTGFRFAVLWGAQVTLQLDGDGQHPADQIPAIVAPILEGVADVAIGSRYVKGAGGNVSTGLRQAGTIFFSKLLQALVGARILDTTSGFRAFSYEAAHFLARYYPDDYPEVEAYVPLARKGFRMTEVPVTMRPRTRGRSSITPLRSVYYMVKVAFATAIDVIRPLPRRLGEGREGEHREGGHGE